MTLHAHTTRQNVLPGELRQALQAQLQGEMELPLFPDTAARVLAASRDESADMQRVSDLITHDQALAIHVLRVANSAAYAPREPIVTLQQAITRLGLTTTCEIAIAVSLKGRLFSVPGHQTRLRDLWMHSAAAAAFAKETASLRSPRNESVFLCGLLHDVGMPLVMQLLTDLVKKQGGEMAARPQLEAAMQEFHRELGAMVVQKWGLGAPVAAAVRHHHEPHKAAAQRDEVLVTALADELAYWALDDGKKREDFRTELREPLGLSEGDLATLLARRGRVIAITEAFL